MEWGEKLALVDGWTGCCSVCRVQGEKEEKSPRAGTCLYMVHMLYMRGTSRGQHVAFFPLSLSFSLSLFSFFLRLLLSVSGRIRSGQARSANRAGAGDG